jgi:hypothetical protein
VYQRASQMGLGTFQTGASDCREMVFPIFSTDNMCIYCNVHISSPRCRGRAIHQLGVNVDKGVMSSRLWHKMALDLSVPNYSWPRWWRAGAGDHFFHTWSCVYNKLMRSPPRGRESWWNAIRWQVGVAAFRTRYVGADVLDQGPAGPGGQVEIHFVLLWRMEQWLIVDSRYRVSHRSKKLSCGNRKKVFDVGAIGEDFPVCFRKPLSSNTKKK